MKRYVQVSSFLIFFSFFDLVFSQLPSTQISTMSKLYDLVQTNTNSSWDISLNPNPCSWKGVSCNPTNSSITRLSLPSFSLTNSVILGVVCEIGTLEFLDLSNNHFRSIPNEFISSCGDLSGLKLLNFSSNKLVGSLPVFQGFVVLEYLDLSFNCLNGSIISQLNGLVGLKGLNLSSNQLAGSIPTSLGSLELLEELELPFNLFSGNIPQEIANCQNLTLINLSGNMLSGSIPNRFSELPKLEILILSANNLTGVVPHTLLGIITLWRFAANQNNFIGNIPLGVTRNLKFLDISYNNLNGTIPIDLLSPLNLQSVDLSHNTLEGSIPSNMSSSLVRLRLGNNFLSGTIPISFGNLQSLMYLELDNNNFTGIIPTELGLCKKLALLNLAQNRLTGTLPEQLGNLTNLQVMMLQFNKFYGEIPIQITQLSKLERLNISWNFLNGLLPSSISRLWSLSNLNLQGNNLSGQIPNTIGNLDFLLELQLGSNQLSGVIPSMPRNLQIALNLSSNNFDGPIPSTLSRMNALEVLDLSNNRFSGEIPDFLAYNLPSLTKLLLSNNQLSGLIPAFNSYVTVLTSGNKNLINITRSSSPPMRKSKRKVSVSIVIGAAAGVLAIGVIVVIALSLSRRYYRINDEHTNSGEVIPQPQIIQGNLLTPNGIHRLNIDFMTAMKAVSHPSNIVLKTRFSTYYKTIMPSGKPYFVKELNLTDKIFQLGSHEKFREELELLGKLSNSNVMIPLAYVLTVDSAYLFYEFSEKGTLFDCLQSSSGNDLEWVNRYSIAIGVAHGLVSLHGCSSGSILLLDLSSKSILLKSLKEPRVGEIELYKVIDPTKSTGNLSTVAGSVGYIPPEYAYTMRVTMDGNVYSFGVILLELLTGKPAVSEGTELTKSVLSKAAQQDHWEQILDYRVSRTSLAVKNQMLATLRVALACVNVSPQARPKMTSVLRMLLNAGLER